MNNVFPSVINALEYLEANYKDTDFSEFLLIVYGYKGKSFNDPMLMDIKIREGDIPDENDPWLLEVNFSFTFPLRVKKRGAFYIRN